MENRLNRLERFNDQQLLEHRDFAALVAAISTEEFETTVKLQYINYREIATPEEIATADAKCIEEVRCYFPLICELCAPVVFALACKKIQYNQK